jgi:hypothetical protein
MLQNSSKKIAPGFFHGAIPFETIGANQASVFFVALADF